MKSVALRTKIITGIITGGMLLSSVSLAFATGIKSTKTDVKTPSKIEFKQPKAELESTLKLGVSTGIITQTESDKILAYENSKTVDKTVKINIYKDLVDNNILTQAKADALKASEQVQRDAQRQKNLDTKLAKLVTDKTITQDQSDKIKAAIVSEEAANKVEKEKTKTMTKAERKSYEDSNKTTHISALKALVDAGTITQAQADKVGPVGAIGGPGKHGKDMKGGVKLESILKLGVSSNIITQSESDKVLAYEKTKTTDNKIKTNVYKDLVDNNILTQAKVDALKANEKALKANEKAQMDTQRQAKMDTKLAKLVTDKTITQDQSDKIKAAIVSEEAANKVEMEKTKTMTAAERKSYMESKKGTHISALKALVNAGTITQAQADKVGHGANNHRAGIKIK
ncbi:hypothetical protein [Clostridium estertheticum]|uniref:hypothetical protein n=1 Tax=Clostridium estertheticum TaxID=238834 RepID=UPI001C7DE406|nr:hypothetical protein [Clostridium estertheticum]MBX4270321.1 hypothetical protein [Clostridium estertheticum]WLC80862.1 hypothetical protein KTC98_06390 [Clostridium estertheticum]